MFTCKQLLAAAICCSPATIQPAVATPPGIPQSVAVRLPCNAERSALSVGSVVYLKGAVRLNDSVTLRKGGQLRHGDTIATPEDGFIGVKLVNGVAIGIPPVTTIKLSCSEAASDIKNTLIYTIGAPHMSAAIRG